jgi:nucleoporin POM152
MLADKPGNVIIVSVGDNCNKCRSFPKNMSRMIHNVPSSFVSGGEDIIENIRQGKYININAIILVIIRSFFLFN